MSPETIFNVHLVMGYVVWLLCFRTYLLPRLKSMEPSEDVLTGAIQTAWKLRVEQNAKTSRKRHKKRGKR